jgi:hypothetical protein
VLLEERVLLELIPIEWRLGSVRIATLNGVDSWINQDSPLTRIFGVSNHLADCPIGVPLGLQLL